MKYAYIGHGGGVHEEVDPSGVTPFNRGYITRLLNHLERNKAHYLDLEVTGSSFNYVRREIGGAARELCLDVKTMKSGTDLVLIIMGCPEYKLV